uniref:MARVEL domain-containing protein n=1 Tax=Panagrolaimus sp. JU765 TaxID=591449 RepID=A0AC34RLW2_9BILA
MNLHRITTLPHALKPILALIILMSMISAGTVENKTPGGWFYWLTTVIQFIFLLLVTALVVMEIERVLTCQRDSWPVAELIYSGTFFVFSVINIFITASWYSETREKKDHDTSTPYPTKTEKSGSALFTTITCVALAILYGLGFFTMYKTWRNKVKSGATQNPTGNVQPGTVEGMHPGL